MKRPAAKLAVLSGLAWPILCWAAEATPQRILEIESQGYSRFEIDGDKVVAYFPDPVVFRFLGYEVTSGSLRYDQHNELAVASGGVRAVSDEYVLEAPSVTFDGKAGIVSAAEGVCARATAIGLSLSGAEAQLSFPPELERAELAAATLIVRGGVRMSDTRGSLAQCQEATFSGADSRIIIPGRFSGRYVLEKPVAGRGMMPDIDAVLFSGDSLVGRVGEDGLLQEAQFSDARLAAGDACFSGNTAQARVIGRSGTEPGYWEFSLTGAPGRGQVLAGDQSYFLTADEIHGSVLSAQRLELELRGETNIWSTDTSLVSTQALLKVEKESLEFSFPKGLRVQSDVAALSGFEPLNLAELRNAS